MKETVNRNRLTSHRGWLAVLMVIFFVYIATLIFPCVWLFLNSLKTDIEFFKDTWALPKEPFKNLENYLTAFDMNDVIKLCGIECILCDRKRAVKYKVLRKLCILKCTRLYCCYVAKIKATGYRCRIKHS